MRAALFHKFGLAPEVTSVNEPECPRDGVIVQVDACGVCRSDWHAWTGADDDVTPPHVGGHEFAGTIIERGPQCSNFEVGQRVTAPFILGCGICPDCRAGEATICSTQHVIGFTAWGAFAERLAMPHADFNLVALPDMLADVSAAAMGCRLTTAWRGLIERAALKSGEWLAVHGAGGVGLSAIMIGKALGARVVAIDINPTSLERARDLGAEQVIDASNGDVAEAVRDATDGGAHVSLDALGITETFQNSLAGLRKLGRHLQIGMPLREHAKVTLPLLEQVYARQIAIIGSRGMAARQFPALLALIERGAIKPEKLVGKTIGLEGLGAEFEAMSRFSGSGITVIDRF